MATKATAQLVQLGKDWKKVLPAAKLSGIVGDTAHAKRGGYHISRQDQVSSSNYSVVRPDDKAGPDNAASAIDMTMTAADMKTVTSRLIKAYNNTADPRRKYINAFNGTTDGTNARRWDVYARTIKSATKDHLWHVHLEVRRRYCTSATAMKAILSIIKGESVEAYLRSIGAVVAAAVTTKPTPAKPAPAKPTPAKVAPVPAPAYPGHDLQRNDRQAKADPALKAWQTQMIKRGWTSLGKADGFFGAKTEKVAKRWQQNCRLKADGMIGRKTWPTAWTRPLGS